MDRLNGWLLLHARRTAELGPEVTEDHVTGFVRQFGGVRLDRRGQRAEEITGGKWGGLFVFVAIGLRDGGCYDAESKIVRILLLEPLVDHAIEFDRGQVCDLCERQTQPLTTECF